MPDYRFTIESEQKIKTVAITSVDGVAHARDILRAKYKFSSWRIVNIAEDLSLRKR